MSRILKRPMFRIGGSTNEGIMNMAVPKRAGYQEPTGAATPLDNYKIDPNDPLFKEAMRNAAMMNQFAGAGKSRDSRLSDLLISGGLNLMSARPSGNIFSTDLGLIHTRHFDAQYFDISIKRHFSSNIFFLCVLNSKYFEMSLQYFEEKNIFLLQYLFIAILQYRNIASTNV